MFRWFGIGVVPLVLVTVGCSNSISGISNRDADALAPGYAVMEGDAGVTLRVEAESFAPGEPVRLILENETGESLGYNLCFHGIERRTGTSWTLLNDSRICTLVLYYLESGGSDAVETFLPSQLTPGEYRYRVAVYLLDGNEYRDQVSNPFQVGG